VKYPTEATLKKYGFERMDYRMAFEAQNGVCAVCKNKKDYALFIDHEHVRGWKKMPPEKRKTFVRGLLCNDCNRYVLHKKVTLEKARNAVRYLENYVIRQKRTIR